MGRGQKMFEAGFVSHGSVGPDCGDDDPTAAGGVKRAKAFVGCEDDPFLLTGDTIDFGILSSETSELFNVQNVVAQVPEQLNGRGRDTLINQETHAEALSLKNVRAVTKSFVEIFRSQMRKLIEDAFDRVAVGQVIKDQGDRDARALDDRLAVHDVFITNDPCKGPGLTVFFGRCGGFGHE